MSLSVGHRDQPEWHLQYGDSVRVDHRGFSLGQMRLPSLPLPTRPAVSSPLTWSARSPPTLIGLESTDFRTSW